MCYKLLCILLGGGNVQLAAIVVVIGIVALVMIRLAVDPIEFGT